MWIKEADITDCVKWRNQINIGMLVSEWKKAKEKKKMMRIGKKQNYIY